MKKIFFLSVVLLFSFAGLVKGQESILPEDGTFGKIYSDYGQLLSYNVHIEGIGTIGSNQNQTFFNYDVDHQLISECSDFTVIEFEDGTPVRVETEFGYTTRVRTTTIVDGHWEVTFGSISNDIPPYQPCSD